MTLATLQAAVLRRAGLPSSDALAAGADLTDLINEALAAISTQKRWPWLETTRSFVTGANVGTYATPTGWVETRQLRIDQYDPMIPSTSIELGFSYSDVADTGRPLSFAIQADQIILRPIPDGAYTVTEVFQQTDVVLVNGADVPLLPAQYEGAVIWWATAELHRRLRNDSRAEAAQSRADDWMKRMSDNARRAVGYPRVRVRGGSLI